MEFQAKPEIPSFCGELLNICDFNYSFAKFMNSTRSDNTPQISQATSQKSNLALPSMEDLPRADVVIFDGECNFCKGQVRKIARYSGKRLAFISLHDPRVSQLWPDLTTEMLMKQMYLVTHNGRRYGGAAVLRYLSRKLPRLWLFAPILHIPFSLGLWQWCYSQVAKRRYKISSLKESDCDNGSCETHFK